MTSIVGVRFKNSPKIYDFDTAGFVLEEGMPVIVSTDLGLSYGVVATFPKALEEALEGATGKSRYKKIQRLATPEDTKKYELYNQDEVKALEHCIEQCKKLNLPMNLFAVEKAFDGSKYTFFFTSEGRVDFRQLVKNLVKRFDAKIEMRQVGIRNQAKMCGGLGRCGRELCCSSFIEEFEPVSIKMAKEQGLSLNPTKISGQCGRLMCCLTYEYETYCAMKKDFPKIGKNIDTPAGRGKVIRHNSLFGTVTVKLENSEEEVSYNVQEILRYKEAMQEAAKNGTVPVKAEEPLVEYDFPLAEVSKTKPDFDEMDNDEEDGGYDDGSFDNDESLSDADFAEDAVDFDPES